ncbi:unnamed protein product [Rotaria sp. Silwood2]|nr:unnamed protein product [Rotaria sp. Silwood2]
MILRIPFRIFSKTSPYENPPRATQYETPKRMDNLQADVNQVVGIMKDNLEKVLERDANLAVVESRTKRGASQFTINARNLKKKYWWKNIKMWTILIIIIIVLIIVIVVAVTQSVKGNNNNNNNNNSNQNTTSGK